MSNLLCPLAQIELSILGKVSLPGGLPSAQSGARRNKCPHQSIELSRARCRANTKRILLQTNHWHPYTFALFITQNL